MSNEYETKLKDLITQFTDAIHDTYDIATPIDVTDIKDIITKLGGTCLETSMYDSEVSRTKSGFHMKLQTFDSTLDERKLWDFAQTLGNLFLSMHYASPDKWQQNLLLVPHKCQTHEEQRQVNLFAASFLMPKTQFLHVILENTNHTTVNTKKVAQHFNVSISDAHWWGVQLGVFRPDF